MKLLEDMSESEKFFATRLKDMLDLIDKNTKETKSTYSKIKNRN